jgi:RNA polymerase sigma-70 factor (ECF subfamily)
VDAGGDSTCWTIVRGAALGRAADREEFARRYEPLVRSYLGARWRGGPLADDVEDAAQEVFVECLREGGAVERADPERAGGFRAFLYGVARNVALRFERGASRRRAKPGAAPFDADAIAADEASLASRFDREWAIAVVREAATKHAVRAASAGPDALRRVDLLRARFQDGLPIREIASRWGVDADRLHHEYARARQEFRAALEEVVASQHPGPAAERAAEVARLLGALR